MMRVVGEGEGLEEEVEMYEQPKVNED